MPEEVQQVSNVRITVRIGATINLGDFNNYKPEFELSADVEPGVSPTAAKNKLRNTVRAWLDADIEDVAGKKIQ